MKIVHYYEVALLRVNAPLLTYSHFEPFEPGQLVSVALRGKQRLAAVLRETEKPEAFETEPVTEVLEGCYTPVQMKIASFISQYYFSGIGEALSLIHPYIVRQNTKEPLPFPTEKRPLLTDIQNDAHGKILGNDTTLLFGVTGSGKTEIFISLIYKMLEEGKSIIFLMPEISLTPQMEKRLRKFFGERVAMWHSGLAKGKKEKILEGIRNGTIDIVAGARSALFVPLENLGLIIVDEEHDDSYKSMTRPRYHARDLAVLMAKEHGAKLLLASATPSPSSYHKYPVVKLGKPYIETTKSYRFIGGDSVNDAILSEIGAAYARGEQSLLFVPTRGNFKYLYCESCGYTHKCPYCSVGMTLHRSYRHLRCHYCGFTEPIRESCAQCGHSPLRSHRMGTSEAVEIIKGHIPGLRIEKFDKDTITTPKKLKEALGRFERHESDLLLGTQMLSKGHDYANITLSIIMGIDHILGLADYRAREKAMSLLVQIAGRSGRAKEARVVIQTNNHELFEPYLGDYEAFLRDELGFAEGLYPPFVSLARILIADKSREKAKKITGDVTGELETMQGIEIVGTGSAPVEMIAGKYRFQILLRSKERIPLLRALHAVNRQGIEIDMDPVDFS